MAEERISTLVNQIKNRELILPEFQRGFIWNKSQVKEYLNSLYCKYPTGNILTWKTPNPEMTGRGIVDSDARYFKLILDGQQRLTSIYTLLEGEPPHFYEGEQLYFNLYFNVLSEEFAYYKPGIMEGNIEWVHVSEFFRKSLGGFLKRSDGFTSEQQKFYFDNFDKLQKLENIKNYLYHTEIIEELEIRKVVDILCLVNSTGTRFSNSDLTLAHICGSWPEARRAFRNSRQHFNEMGYKFDLDLFMRCTSVIATNSAQYESFYTVKGEDIKNAWYKAEKSLNYLLNVLKSDAFINSEKAIGNYNVLIPIVYFLSHRYETEFKDDREKNSFLHWFYAAVISGRFSRSTNVNLREDVDAVKKRNPTEKLRGNLLKSRGGIRIESDELDKAALSGLFLSMLKALIVKNGAIDLFNGTRLNGGEAGISGELFAQNILPQTIVCRSRPDLLSQKGRSFINQLANIAFLKKKVRVRIDMDYPLSYLRKIQSRFPDALKSQLIPEDESLWKLEAFEEFLARRREMIAAAINDYLDGLLSPEDKANLTIEDLIARGKNTGVEFRRSLIWDHEIGNVSRDVEKSIAMTICAFLNSESGTLLVGVDNGHIYGLDEDLAAAEGGNEEGLKRTFRGFMQGFIGKDNLSSINVSFSTTNNKKVMIISVKPSLKPVFLEDGIKAEFYVRSADRSVLLDLAHTDEYIRSHWKSIEI